MVFGVLYDRFVGDNTKKERYNYTFPKIQTKLSTLNTILLTNESPF